MSTPAIKSVITSFTLSEIKNTIENTSNAPSIAEATNDKPLGTKVNPIPTEPNVINATPNPAPELMPRMYGLASGFLNRTCINNPLTDREAPAIIAPSARGNLDCKIIVFQTSF